MDKDRKKWEKQGVKQRGIDRQRQTERKRKKEARGQGDSKRGRELQRKRMDGWMDDCHWMEGITSCIFALGKA